MQTVEDYKIFGPLCAAAVWAAILIIVKKWPGHRSMTISAHAAAYKEAYLFFAIVRSFANPFFALFLFGWFIPALRLPTVASVLAALFLVFDLVTAWIPQVPGWKGTVHKVTAYAMASLYLPLAVIIALSPEVSDTARVIIYGCITAMVVYWGIFAVSKKPKEYFLYFQMTYFILFDTVFLSAAFL
jgi:hypothetical protein